MCQIPTAFHKPVIIGIFHGSRCKIPLPSPVSLHILRQRQNAGLFRLSDQLCIFAGDL
jgi:hypothetical protein